jgi:hypothetical protein
MSVRVHWLRSLAARITPCGKKPHEIAIYVTGDLALGVTCKRCKWAQQRGAVDGSALAICFALLAGLVGVLSLAFDPRNDSQAITAAIAFAAGGLLCGFVAWKLAFRTAQTRISQRFTVALHQLGWNAKARDVLKRASELAKGKRGVRS